MFTSVCNLAPWRPMVGHRVGFSTDTIWGNLTGRPAEEAMWPQLVWDWRQDVDIPPHWILSIFNVYNISIAMDPQLNYNPSNILSVEGCWDCILTTSNTPQLFSVSYFIDRFSNFTSVACRILGFDVQFGAQLPSLYCIPVGVGWVRGQIRNKLNVGAIHVKSRAAGLKFNYQYPRLQCCWAWFLLFFSSVSNPTEHTLYQIEPRRVWGGWRRPPCNFSLLFRYYGIKFIIL